MKKLLKYLKKYSLEAVLGPLFKLLEATFELIVPLVVAAIITPTTDAFTLIVVALPIWLLYELSIVIVRITE